MRMFLLFILILVFFSSCSKYQCLTISSDNTSRNERNEFVIENDTLRIIYSFYNSYGTVHVSVLNKSSKGIRTDWARSFVIVGENPWSFFNPEMQIQGELDKSNSGHAVLLNATTSQPQELQFIPPQATISRSGPSLTKGRFLNPDGYTFKKEGVRVMGFSKKLKRARLKREESPLKFRIYLTLIPEEKTEKEPLVFDRSFYVSELICTKAETNVVFPRSLNGNMIIMKKSTITGSILMTTVTIGLLILVAAAAGG